MKVFKVDADADRFQIVLPVTYNSEIHDLLSFDGTSKKNTWKPIEFYVENPLDELGNFFALSYGNAFVCDKTAVNTFRKYWDLAGELLPIFLKDGRELYIFNVTNCLTVLDCQNTLFDYYQDGTRGRVLKFVFNEHGFSESSIFKIPETAKTQVLTFTNFDYHDDFYNTYSKSGLQGLAFEKLYSNE